MKLLTTADAARLITAKTGKPMSLREVQRECRLDRLAAEKIAGIYFLEAGAIDHYVRRKPGPKPKVKA